MNKIWPAFSSFNNIAVPSKLINVLLWLVLPDEICLTQQQHLVNGSKGNN